VSRMKERLPWLKFWKDDWRRDTRVLSSGARGVWMECILTLWPQGKRTLTLEAWCRETSLKVEEFEAGLAEIEAHDIAVVSRSMSHDCHTLVTVLSRRLSREEELRKHAQIRQVRSRGVKKLIPVTPLSQTCHASVTPPVTPLSRVCHAIDAKSKIRVKKETSESDSESESDSLTVIKEKTLSLSSSITKNQTTSKEGMQGENETPYSLHEICFDQFWKAYPNKKAKQAARKAFLKIPNIVLLLPTIVNAVTKQKTWPTWTKDAGEFIPHPATWLNAHGWEDEPVVIPPTPKPKPKFAL